MGPLLPTLNIQGPEPSCQDYLTALYDRFCHKKTNTTKEISLTYGEILYESMSQLFKKWPLRPDDIFIDLGSGTGKLPLQIFLTTSVKEAIGIELVPGLHNQAVEIAAEVQKDAPVLFNEGRKLTLICDDFLQHMPSGTVMFINSICYSQRFLCRLGAAINTVSTVRLVLTLRPIPTLKHLLFLGVERLEATWDSTICYVYGVE